MLVGRTDKVQIGFQLRGAVMIDINPEIRRGCLDYIAHVVQQPDDSRPFLGVPRFQRVQYPVECDIITGEHIIVFDRQGVFVRVRGNQVFEGRVGTLVSQLLDGIKDIQASLGHLQRRRLRPQPFHQPDTLIFAGRRLWRYWVIVVRVLPARKEKADGKQDKQFFHTHHFNELVPCILPPRIHQESAGPAVSMA